MWIRVTKCCFFRDVEESLLLKDSEENRREQTALYEQTDEFRQRMDRKKKRKLSDKIRYPVPVP